MLYRRSTQALLVAVCLWASLPTFLFGQDVLQVRRDEAAKLTTVVTSDAPVFEKAKACQRLAVIGGADAVEALAGLLADETLSNYARYALEAIPDAAADRTLREAMARLDGDLLIGVLNSISQRRDAKAVEALDGLVASENAAVAEAAARALGHIGNRQTADLLRSALAKAAPDRRAALAKACLICSQRLLQRNDRKGAVELSDFVRHAKVPKHLVLAATHSAILARGSDGIPLLVVQLNSDDEARFRLALHVARLIDGDVSAQLIAHFGTQSPDRQALMVIALGDLNDDAAVPTIVKAAGSGPPVVRIQAIRVLSRIATADAGGTLLAAAFDSNDRVAQAARSSLASFKGSGTDEAIVAMLGSGDADKLKVAIDLAARRRIAAAAPALLRLADSRDASLRTVAIKALGSTIQLADLPKLLAKADAADTSDELDAAREAARAACVRMPQDECAVLLSGRLSGADAAMQAFLMEQLGTVGGSKALAAVVAAARSDDDAMQDAATRVLGQWLSAKAAPAMFELAKSPTSNKYKIRVLRGYVRLARQFDMPLEQRMEVCRNTLSIAERADEKTLVLAVLRRYPAPDGLDIASSLLNDAKLKEPACGVIVAISEKIVATSPTEVETALRQVVQTTRRQAVADRAEELIAEAQESLKLN